MNGGKSPKSEDTKATGPLSLAELIAQTPGAQTREQLVERHQGAAAGALQEEAEVNARRRQTHDARADADRK